MRSTARVAFSFLAVILFVALMGWVGYVERETQRIMNPSQIVDDSATPDPYHGICWEDGSCEDGYCDPEGLCAK